MASFYDSFDALTRISHSLNSTYRQFDVLQQMNRQNLSAITGSLQWPVSDALINGIAKNNLNTLYSLNLDIFNKFSSNEILNTISMQWDAIAKTTQMYCTPEIVELKNYFLTNDYFSGIQAFLPAITGKIIEAPNIAFLKEASLFANSISSALPPGVKTIVKEMHAGTAKRLSVSEDVGLDVEEKNFFDEANPDNIASIKETNIICSALNILKGFSETDLFDFMNYIAKYPEFASEHNIGRRIYDVISAWDYLIDFDNGLYYHARSFEQGGCPYTEAQLSKAPYGVTWHGRYNHVGENHYYFSNSPKGAAIEVGKHSAKNTKIQIAKLRPLRKIAMIDLSDTNSQSKFLEYCRFQPNNDDYSKIKREYLIPCFVASCCKRNSIEGIKYYGSKEYSNYVSWSDHYFECVGYDFYE